MKSRKRRKTDGLHRNHFGSDRADLGAGIGILIPWIKERVGADKLKKWQAYVEIAVKAAEQLYNANEGAEKKAYVLQYLAERGIKFDSDTVDKMIESAVLTLHHELYGGNNGTEN